MKRSIADLAEAGVLAFGDGYRTRRDELGASGFRIIRVRDVNSESISFQSPDFVISDRERAIGAKRAVENDVVLTTKGSVGRVAIVPALDENAVYSPQVCYFRIYKSDELNVRWFFYWLQSPEFWTQARDRMNNTDMAAYVNLADIASLQLTVPTIAHQARIVAVLGALDDKIASNNRVVALSRETIRALYARAILTAGESRLVNELDITYGEPFKGEYFTTAGSGRPLIRIRDLRTSAPVIWTTESRVRETMVQSGDVVVGMDAEFRASMWVGEPGLLNQRVCLPRGRRFGNAYLREALRAPLARLENEKVATTVIHLNKADLERETLVIAAQADLDQFERQAQPIYDHELVLAQETCKLRRLRDALVPALLSGDLTIRDAERQLEGTSR
jgi:type I restriction enzyme S subunit